MTRPHRERWALMELFDIPSSRNPDVTYLRRLRIVETPLLSLYRHQFYMPDQDRDPHDHPWFFISLVIKGSYVERVYERGVFVKERKRRRFSVAIMPLRYGHHVERIDARGTVTLILAGPSIREWGFWTDGQWVPWRTYRAYQRRGIITF